MKTKNVAKINNVEITIMDGAEKLVPIKPICEALGINHSSQVVKIQKDEILSTTVVLNTTVGADQKDREMLCLPYMYALGWLFSINPKNVNAEARENVVKYKQECYKALFNHFTEHSEFLEQKQLALEKQLGVVDRIGCDFGNKKKQFNEAKKTLNTIKEMTFEQWQMNKRQLSIDFPN